MEHADELSALGKKASLTAREIQTAVRLALPGELAKHAVSEGTKSVTKYNGSEKSKKEITRSGRAGLQFPVGRVHRCIKEGSQFRIGATAAVYLAAVLEYLTAEVMELAGNATRDSKHVRVIPRHIFLAIHNDEELSKLFRKCHVASGGTMPNIHSALLPSGFRNSTGDDNEDNDVSSSVSTGMTTSFGQTVAASTSTFGSFGQTIATPTTFGSAPSNTFGASTSLFGQTTTPASTSTFGSFGQTSTPSTSSGFGSTFSFGQTTAPSTTAPSVFGSVNNNMLNMTELHSAINNISTQQPQFVFGKPAASTFGTTTASFGTGNNLPMVKGQNFRHEKTKKKRGAFTGSVLAPSVNSINFDSASDSASDDDDSAEDVNESDDDSNSEGGDSEPEIKVKKAVAMKAPPMKFAAMKVPMKKMKAPAKKAKAPKMKAMPAKKALSSDEGSMSEEKETKVKKATKAKKPTKAKAAKTAPAMKFPAKKKAMKAPPMKSKKVATSDNDDEEEDF
eukprot:TRINITY_DN1715_c0_g1_i1.p1 TRINITY_DN1715_c0_g1~~TRINITY_DN1715_c0_g1_i1.p1  ORF type:complete len:562 (+),score=104.25 TRINITY_DN1715_c0_g1_i1:170-1687(+)